MKRILFNIVTVILLIGLISGCYSKENSSRSIAIALGSHQYFPEINLRTKEVYNNIYDTSYAYGNVSVIVVDGDPFLYADYQFTSPTKHIDSTKRKQIATENTQQIIWESQNAMAKTPEIDTLKALIMAANVLNSKGCTDSYILMYDSGFSTTGLLNFAEENLINVDPEDIVSRLKELNSVPNLDGIRVIWSGCGEVCGAQSKLTEDYKVKLKAIWTAIIEAGGGSVTICTNALSSNTQKVSLPYCSTIPIIQDSLNLTKENLSNPIKFDENSSIKFVQDSATFIDEDAAIKELNPIAQCLKANPTINILIIGTTATSGSEEYKKDLSYKRAEACKNTLVNLGVSKEKIQTIGIGSTSCSLHINDLNSDGSLNKEIAPQNRAVYIVNTSSNTANEILNVAKNMNN